MVQGATVVCVLVALELLVFRGYFTGAVSPAPDDFIGSYNNEPLAWWRDLLSGGLPDWIPYAWGGYPAAVSIQNGSWYLPLGLTAAVAPYTIHAAAVLQALHVGFGALGVYVLGRRWGLGHLSALFGLASYFFAVGFFSNGLHPDIVRGFAWAPWVVLCLSPAFAWRSRWGVPLATVVFWQALVGAYPGVLVALGYAGVVWVVACQVTRRPRIGSYLAPLAVAAACALLLALPKYLPAMVLRGGASPTGQDDSVFSPAMWGTLFFRYDLPSLPNDLSMRSFFVVAPVWALVAVAWRHRARVAVPAAAALTAVVLGMPWLPWYHALAALPGLGMSRFRMADFRVPLVLSLVVIAMVVLSAELRGAAGGGGRRRSLLTAGALVAVPLAAGVAATGGGYTVEQVAQAWTVLAVACTVVGWLTVRVNRERGPARRSAAAACAVALTGIAAISGVGWAFDVTPPWRFDREEIETSTWGSDSAALISTYQGDDGLAQRPARVPLDDTVAPPTDVHWNAAFYTGSDAVGGYVNLKGSESFAQALRAVTDDGTYFTARSLLAAPGIAVAVPDDASLPPVDATEACVLDHACGAGVTVVPDGYSAGHLRYQVTTAAAAHLLFNEAFYPGWRATLCAPSGGSCSQADVSMGAAGLVLADVPAGTWEVLLDYTTPFRSAGLWLFVVGAVAATVGGWWWGRARPPAALTAAPPAPPAQP